MLPSFFLSAQDHVVTLFTCLLYQFSSRSLLMHAMHVNASRYKVIVVLFTRALVDVMSCTMCFLCTVCFEMFFVLFRKKKIKIPTSH